MTRPEPENRQRRGTVFIVDISGYSKFVMSTEPADGAYIMEVLLEALLPEITPQFKVSEIEGDAVLFYRLDDPVPVHTILAQFQSMLDRFEQKVAILACSFPQVTPLTLNLSCITGRYSNIWLPDLGSFTASPSLKLIAY
jgi:hypothetical protein